MSIFEQMSKDIKQFFNAIRTLEISYEVEDRHDKTILENIKSFREKERAENVALSIEFAKKVSDLKEENEIKSLKLLEDYFQKKYENEGLLPTRRQLENDVNYSWAIYKYSNLVDDFNNFKPGVEEVLKGE